MSDSLGLFSQNLARSWGEPYGRSVSRVWGDGLASLIGGRNNGTATEVVHGAMAAGTVGVASGAVPLPAVLLGAALLWAAGQSPAATSQYGRARY